MADPIQSNVYQTNIPEQLLPYQRQLLDQASAFTDVIKNPYQQYQGERVAQFSPLQQQAFENAGQMGVAGQIGAATDIASQAGLAGLGAQYTPLDYQAQSFLAPGTAQSYMSPYMQNVVDYQQREAKRQADIAGTARGAQAARAGAFGGSRQAIENAEANRALQSQLQGIQATGLQNAYQQAQQQFNQEQAQRQSAAQLGEQSRQFGAGLGMQGLQNALQSANVLGGLGSQQFSQGQGTIQTQYGLGTGQQQRAQDILNAQFQDFQNYQNYPFKTLGFMSDILRGTPLTQTSASMYQSAPTALQNLTSLGLGAYGINQLFPSKASGGTVSSYADGGSVFSRANKERIVGDMHPYGLPRALQGAMMRGDMETAGAAQDEMSMDAAIRRGIAAAAPTDIGVGYANGGIVAFSEGNLVGAPATSAEAASRLYGRTLPKRAEGEDYVSAVKGIRGSLEGLYEPSEAIPLYQRMIEQQEARIPDIEREGRGLTALRAAAALQKSGVNPGDRYAGAFEAAASGAEKTAALKKAANDEITKSRLLMAQANDARKKGLTDLAVGKQAEAENRADKAFELNRAADIELYKGLGTQERLDKEITARAQESAADRTSRENIAAQQIAAQKEIAAIRTKAIQNRGQLTPKDLIIATQRAQQLARSQLKDYRKSTKGFTDKRSDEEILKTFERDLLKGIPMAIGFGPTGEIFDDSED